MRGIKLVSWIFYVDNHNISFENGKRKNADAANSEEQAGDWKDALEISSLEMKIMKRLDGWAKNRDLLQSLMTKENVYVDLEQCEGCLGISPVTDQGRNSGTALFLDKCKQSERKFGNSYDNF